jgi:hypothetical protein
MDSFDPKLVAYALMAATLVKVVVDLVKMAAEVPQWVAPTLALLGGILFVVVIMIGSGVVMTAPMYAQAVIAGVLSGGMSIGSTALQSRTKPSTDAHHTVSVPATREP